jgi:RNA-directed DNA polymerase
MTKAAIGLQDLRRRIYRKAKAEPAWRFWGLYVHVCKEDTLQAAYEIAKRNDGAPGIDGVSFAAIESAGREGFLQRLRDALVSGTYRPTRNREKQIPKATGGVRILGIPTISDRVVQGALKLILEPIFDADFQEGSYGYRPQRTAHQAVDRVAEAVVHRKTQVIDIDLRAYFDTIRHDLLLEKVARRVDDDRVLHLLKQTLKASGKRGVAQGSPLSPLLSNLYLNDVDQMLERAKEATRSGRFTYLEYARYADDIVILVDGYARWAWLRQGVWKRLLETLADLDIQLNMDKSRVLDLAQGDSFRFLGFDFREATSRCWSIGKEGR